MIAEREDQTSKKSPSGLGLILRATILTSISIALIYHAGGKHASVVGAYPARTECDAFLARLDAVVSRDLVNGVLKSLLPAFENRGVSGPPVGVQLKKRQINRWNLFLKFLNPLPRDAPRTSSQRESTTNS